MDSPNLARQFIPTSVKPHDCIISPCNFRYVELLLLIVELIAIYILAVIMTVEWSNSRVFEVVRHRIVYMSSLLCIKPNCTISMKMFSDLRGSPCLRGFEKSLTASSRQETASWILRSVIKLLFLSSSSSFATFSYSPRWSNETHAALMIRIITLH